MTTLAQLVRNRNNRLVKRKKNRVPGLCHCPHKRGVVQRLFIEKPKKPNSARRQAAKVKLSTKRIIACHIPGEGHTLTKHSVVLIRGGRTQDLIGFRYRPVRGKFDFRPLVGRKTRLSKYGLPGVSVRRPKKSSGEVLGEHDS